MSSKKGKKNRKKQARQKEEAQRDQDSTGRDHHDPTGQIAESRHYQEVLQSYRAYSEFMMLEVARRDRHMAKIPAKYADKLPTFMIGKIDELKRAALANQDFINQICRSADESGFGPQVVPGTDRVSASMSNYSKVVSTLHQCSREWAADGQSERHQTFTPILDELERLLPVNDGNRDRQRVLVPGCGLSRLPIEFVGRGYAAEGNEFSYHMLLMSHFMLNRLQHVDQFDLFPWIDKSCNVVTNSQMLRRVTIPDRDPHSFLKGENRNPCLSMCAGEFLEVYADQAEEWDSVVTCFFLDTAPNAIEYIEAIERLLKPGGVWINFGPLMYHWCSSSEGDFDERFHRSVEFSYEEMHHLVQAFGFEFAREESRRVYYSANRLSMMKTEYTCAFFSAVKPKPGQEVKMYQDPNATSIFQEDGEGGKGEEGDGASSSDNQMQDVVRDV